jgi:hypothetical protein
MKAHTQHIISEEYKKITNLIEILQSKERCKQFRCKATIEERKALRINLNALIGKKKRIEIRNNCKLIINSESAIQNF